MLRFRKGPKPNKYTPRPTKIRNPLVVANVQMMYKKWKAKGFPRFILREWSDPHSLTSIKKDLHCTRHQARLVRDNVRAQQAGGHHGK